MNPVRAVLCIVVATVVLFTWSGLTQALPWGVPSAQQLESVRVKGEHFGGVAPVEAPPGTWTTPAFDGVVTGRVSTLTTDGAFAWIVAIPRDGYDPGRYFAVELLTQLAVAAGLTGLIGLLAALGRRRRLVVVGLAGVLASLGTYGVMANWWGLTALYAGGMSVNLVAGWLLAAAAVEAVLRVRTSGSPRRVPAGA